MFLSFYTALGFAVTEPDVLVADRDEIRVYKFGFVFLMFAVVLLSGKLSNFVDKFQIPRAIGELGAGIALSALGYAGLEIVSDMRRSAALAFLAAFGAFLSLFYIGLELNLHELKRVGKRVVAIGIASFLLPFLTGIYIAGPLLFPEKGEYAHLFLATSLAATSVGVAVSIYNGLDMFRTRTAQASIGAALLGNVLTLVVLSIISGFSKQTALTVPAFAWVAFKSFVFLVGALLAGSAFAEKMSHLFSKISRSKSMKIAVALSFALVLGYIAELVGLQPVIGAFAAGLLLDGVHFDQYNDSEVVRDLKAIVFEDKRDKDRVLRVIRKHREAHVEDLVSSLGVVFIPVFYVYTGLQVDFHALLHPEVFALAVIVWVLACLPKVCAGLLSVGKPHEKLMVGASLMPRAEIGLLVAAIGKSAGRIDDSMYAVIVLAVLLTTLFSPSVVRFFALPEDRKKTQKVIHTVRTSWSLSKEKLDKLR